MTDIMPEEAMERLAARAGWAIQDECGVTSKPWSDEGMRAALAVLDEMGLTPTTAASLMAGEVVVVPSASHMTLRDANIARQAEWDGANGKLSLSFRGVELAGEVGEACNVIKKLERERVGLRGSRATREQLAEELADVVICADLTAMDAGIDLLGQAVPAKFNATSEKNGLATRLAAAQQKDQG